MKKFTEETNKKKVITYKNNKDKEEMQKQQLVERIKEDSKEMLLPTLKSKMEETTQLIVNTLKEKDMTNIQIMSLIAKGSLLETALGGGVSYTSQELKIVFNEYLDMINKINDIKPFPPTIESFANFIGISRETYNNYLADPSRRDVMNYIHSYLMGVLAAGGLTGELREISSIFIQKSMGKVEQTQPVVVEHKKVIDIDEIKQKLALLKKDNVAEASYDEKRD